MSNIIKIEEQKQELDYIKHLAKIAADSGKYGSLTLIDIVNVMLTAKDLGISPMKALNGGFYIVNGKISMSTSLMADRIRKEGHSIKIPEWTDQKCVLIGVRKDNGDSVKFEFTMEDAQRAGLTGSPTWKKFPKQMLYNRAMSTLARTLFPDVVGNAYSEDEKFDIMNVPPQRRDAEDPDCIQVSSLDHPLTQVAESQSIPLMGSPFETLNEVLCADGIDVSRLQEYVEYLCEKKNASAEKIVESALLKGLTQRFKTTYVKWLEESITKAEV